MSGEIPSKKPLTNTQKKSFERAIECLNELIKCSNEYDDAPDVKEITEAGCKTPEQTEIAVRMKENHIRLENNTDFTALNNKDYLSLQAVLGSLICEGGEDIYMYDNHAYNIREIKLVGKNGKPLDASKLYAAYMNYYESLNNKSADDALYDEYKIELDKLKDLVDIDKTIVVIQNPHGSNKQVYPKQKETQEAVGTWNTTLRELLATTTFTSVIIRNQDNSRTGKCDVKPA